MSSVQTLLTIGALILLGAVILNVNRSLTENEGYLNQTRFGLEAISLATSLIEVACQLPFDEVSWDSTKLEKKVSDFTIPQNLGPDAGESGFDTFDDFDDFNNYTYRDTTEQNTYLISCTVCYIDPMTPDVKSMNRTYCKKLTITITNDMAQDTLRTEYIHGYWYFN